MNQEDDCAVTVADETDRIALRVAHSLSGVLVVRSLSDGAKLKSTILVQRGKKFSEDASQGSFKSLTLSAALKSLSDSKLDCSSRVVDHDHLKQHQQQNHSNRRNQLVTDGSEIEVVGGTFIEIKTGNLAMQEPSGPTMSEGLVTKGGHEGDTDEDFEEGFCEEVLKRPSTKSQRSIGSSASLELDSGRASDTGTLGQSSTTSGCSSSSSSTDGVRIVSHSFCDFISGAASKKKNRCIEEDSSFCSLSPTSTGGSTSSSSSSYYYFGERPSLLLFEAGDLQSNKVSVFVPYSTLLRERRENFKGERETIVDCDEDCEFDKVVEARGVEEDNVFICSDTQVILRINSTQHDEVGMQNSTSLPPATASVAPTTTNTIAPASNNPNHKSSVDNSSESLSVVSGTSKLYSKRMTKRITSTIQMSLNSSEESPAPITESNLAVQDKSRGLRGRLPRPPPISPRIIVRKCQSVTPTSSREDLKELPDDEQGLTEARSVSESRKDSGLSPLQPPPVRRKDLCKLLGLTSQVEAVKDPKCRVAQKVALLHTSKTTSSSSDGPQSDPASEAEPVKRKNLAKFFGVENLEEQKSCNEGRHCNKENLSISRSISSAGEGSLTSKSTRGRTKRLLPNYLGQLVKSWRDGTGSSTGGEDRDGCDDIEMEVPVQLLQLPSNEGERTNRKDLSKFLGLDDSDGEEIVFIQTRPPQHLRNRPPLAETSFESNGLCKSRSFSSSSLKLTNNDGQNTIDQFLRASIRKNARNDSDDWIGSLGKASLRRAMKSAEADSRSEDFDLPPRKSVLFKEYAFSVQESIATGLPIIPFVGPGLPQPGGERKRKKDAVKRSAEINGRSKSDHISNVGGTSLEALLRIANEEWLRENEDEQTSSNLNTSIETSEHSSTSLASTVKRSFNTNLITLDRRQTPPARMAVHPKVLEATKTILNSSSSSSVESNSCNSKVENNNGTPKSGARGTVVFGPTSHRWIPRRTNARDSYVDMYLHHQQFHFPQQQFVCRPAQFYAALPVHQPNPAYFAAYQPPRMPVYPGDNNRVKLVRRNPVRQMAQTPDYVDMRQIKLPPAFPNDDE